MSAVGQGDLHHLAVDAACRHQVIARLLLDRCFERFHEAAVPKCNIFLFSDNDSGAAFWKRNGWSSRPDLLVFQKAVPSGR
jgi:N-acetylglutamate synthase